MSNEKIFLEFKSLSKSYLDGARQKRVVLDNIDERFFEGEIIGIVGKSGSGKSTLLNLISGIDQVTSGDIELYGKNTTGMDERQLTTLRRNQIGFIFQFFNLLPTLTVWENVCLPLELKNMLTPQDYQRAESFLSEVGMVDRKNEFPDKLSGGEQQRVAIARALVHNPSLILADEPTGNLDEQNAGIIMQLLIRLTKENGNNMIFVTHSKDASMYADRVFTIMNGKLVQQ